MELNEYKDRLFDVINETDNLLITDIMVNNSENTMKILLDDHSDFIISCSPSGQWIILK